MPRIPGTDEYGKGGGDFGTLESDEYRLRIDSYEERENKPNKFNPEGKGTSIWFFMTPVAYEHDPEAELLDKDTGEPISPDKTLIFFYDPKRTGIYQGRIAKSRKFLAAALNVPVEEPIEFDSYDELLGKEIVASVIVVNGQNRVEDVRPVKQRKARTASTKKVDAVKEAREVFAEEIEEDEEY